MEEVSKMANESSNSNKTAKNTNARLCFYNWLSKILLVVVILTIVKVSVLLEVKSWPRENQKSTQFFTQETLEPVLTGAGRYLGLF